MALGLAVRPATIADADANECADVDGDAILAAGMAIAVLNLGQLDPKTDYPIHVAANRLGQLL